MAAVYAQSPTERRPSAPKVYGILSIIFASVTLLFSLFTLLGTLAADSLGSFSIHGSLGEHSRLFDELRDQVTGFYGKLAFQPGTFVVMSAVLLGVGVGQLGYKRWARKWSVLWGWVALGAIALLSLLSFVVLGPAYDALVEGMSRVSTAGTFSVSGMGTFVGVGSTVAMVLFMAPYPILLIATFSGKRARDAMTN